MLFLLNLTHTYNIFCLYYIKMEKEKEGGNDDDEDEEDKGGEEKEEIMQEYNTAPVQKINLITLQLDMWLY